MKSNQSKPVLGAIIVAIVLGGWVTLQGQNSSAKPAAIAVVDVQKVFTNMKEKAAMEAEITRQTEQIQKEEQDRQQEVKQLQNDLNLLNPDSASFKTTESQLEEKVITLKAWREFKFQSLEREKAVRIEGLYLKVVDAIGRMAKKQGYDLVLTNDTTERLRGNTQQQLAAQINIRKVLYASTSLDISDQVLQSLDNEFDTRK